VTRKETEKKSIFYVKMNKLVSLICKSFNVLWGLKFIATNSWEAINKKE